MKSVIKGFIVLMMSMSSLMADGIAFPGAEGFGANSLGGKNGKVIIVTRLDDNPKSPEKGSLRWAVQQKGPRIVKFAVAGTIALKDILYIREPYLTIDGSDAPYKGICIKNYALHLKDTHDIIMRYIRVRRGDVKVLENNEDEGIDRPENSSGLDCITMDDSKNVIIDHCSLSWSCDEIFGIVGCENVTIQWCIISEPLSNPAIHPYGDDHAYCLNLSANTLSVHHCLLANYVMRGPQFETNDITEDQYYDVQMESINNVIFDYKHSGSRYKASPENNKNEEIKFKFQFMNNVYINPNKIKPEIKVYEYGNPSDRIKVYIANNIGPNRPTNNLPQLACVFIEDQENISQADSDVRNQISNKLLFSPPVPVTIDNVENVYSKVLATVGCSINRDKVDKRILKNVRERIFSKQIKSQNDVGGWPSLR